MIKETVLHADKELSNRIRSLYAWIDTLYKTGKITKEEWKKQLLSLEEMCIHISLLEVLSLKEE